MLNNNFFNWEASNPLEQFEINDFAYFQVPLLSTIKVSLTNIGFYLLIVLALIITINMLTSNNRRITPSRWSITQEGMYGSILGMVRDQIGATNEIYVPLIFVFFNFVLFNNLIGLVPYSFTPTSHLVLTIGLSTAILIGVTIIGLVRHGLVFFSYLKKKNKEPCVTRADHVAEGMPSFYIFACKNIEKGGSDQEKSGNHSFFFLKYN
jgi:F-type H+-transporting ATPase subunit a